MNGARLVLVRHGEPVGHDGRCIGHTDTALAPAGARAIRSLAESMNVVPQLVVTSDLRRAADSANTLAEIWSSRSRSDARLRELAFGDWDGRTWDDIRATDPAALDRWGADWVRVAPPGGESGEMLARRATTVLDELLTIATRDACPVVVVSHAGWIRIATTLLLGEPLDTAFARSIAYAHAAVFDINDDRPVLRLWNAATLERPAP